jgi:hyperosmotically inducible periplasmic protein
LLSVLLHMKILPTSLPTLVWACAGFIGLTGACSENSPRPANDAASVAVTEPRPAEPEMRPASLEGSSTTPPPRADAPLVADTKVPNLNEAKQAPAGDRTNGQESTTATRSPDASASAPAPQPDNTKVNERDRSSASPPTPLDQRENQTDLGITQQIRQAVMKDDKLSFTAKNVKIITQGGKVTLRGPVNSVEERSAIEAAARKVAGVTAVENQIEVKK